MSCYTVSKLLLITAFCKLFETINFIGNAVTCRQIPQSSSMRDMEWFTNTCTITFTTLGIWPETADGTDINGCDRSHDSRLMATGDDFGKVKLFSYPVIQPKVNLLINYSHV